MSTVLSSQLAGRVFHSASQKNVAVVLAVLFLLNKVYDCVFIVAEIALYIYKGSFLPYDVNDIGLEAALLALLVLLDIIRFGFGVKGNLTQRLPALFLSLFLTPAVLMIGIHVMIWQTYVTRLDYIFGAILISFHAAECVFVLIAILLCMMRPSSLGKV